MKYYELSKEEKKLLKQIEAGEFVPVKNLANEMKKAVAAAKNTFDKRRNINIRLSERDLQKLKTKAMEEGIPYQTLVTSIIHKAVTQSSKTV